MTNEPKRNLSYTVDSSRANGDETSLAIFHNNAILALLRGSEAEVVLELIQQLERMAMNRPTDGLRVTGFRGNPTRLVLNDGSECAVSDNLLRAATIPQAPAAPPVLPSDEEMAKKVIYAGCNNTLIDEWVVIEVNLPEMAAVVAQYRESILAAHRAAHAADDGWRDIESAPKDGSWILIWGNHMGDGPWTAFWDEQNINGKAIKGWNVGTIRNPDFSQAQYWRPLPTPPRNGRVG